MEMLNPAEVVSLMLSVFVIVYIFANLKDLTGYFNNLLIISQACIMVGLIFTILEAYYLPFLFNLLEHLFFAIAAVLIALGCRHQSLSSEDEEGTL